MDGDTALSFAEALCAPADVRVWTVDVYAFVPAGSASSAAGFLRRGRMS